MRRRRSGPAPAGLPRHRRRHPRRPPGHPPGRRARVATRPLAHHRPRDALPRGKQRLTVESDESDVPGSVGRRYKAASGPNVCVRPVVRRRLGNVSHRPAGGTAARSSHPRRVRDLGGGGRRSKVRWAPGATMHSPSGRSDLAGAPAGRRVPAGRIRPAGVTFPLLSTVDGSWPGSDHDPDQAGRESTGQHVLKQFQRCSSGAGHPSTIGAPRRRVRVSAAHAAVWRCGPSAATPRLSATASDFTELKAGADEAAFRISLASFRSRTSARNRRISSNSSLVGPERCPA
jgi:hypothetical protein